MPRSSSKNIQTPPQDLSKELGNDKVEPDGGNEGKNERKSDLKEDSDGSYAADTSTAKHAKIQGTS